MIPNPRCGPCNGRRILIGSTLIRANDQLEFRSPAVDNLSAGHGRLLHILAVLTACATFPLIFMGGLVTSHHAGMSVPDWPNSYGYNMFLFPPNQWIGGVLYEHTHRLMATVVGFCAVVLTLNAWGWGRNAGFRRWLRVVITLDLAGIIALLVVGQHGSGTFTKSAIQQGIVGLTGTGAVCLVAYFCRRREPRRWVRWLCAGVLGMVIFQGILGGLRVVLVDLDLAIVHACTAQLFFCLAVFAAIATSRWWIEAPPLAIIHSPARGVVWLGGLTVGIIFLQLVVGAMMRHFGAGLAIPDFPLAYGKWLPPVTDAGLTAINHHRAFDLNLDPVTLWQVWLHFGHRLGALLVCVAVIAFSWTVLRSKQRAGLTWAAVTLIVLLATQVTLGILTVLLWKPADVASTHVAIGALVLVTSFFMMVRLMRMNRRIDPAPVRQDAAPRLRRESVELLKV